MKLNRTANSSTQLDELGESEQYTGCLEDMSGLFNNQIVNDEGNMSLSTLEDLNDSIGQLSSSASDDLMGSDTETSFWRNLAPCPTSMFDEGSPFKHDNFGGFERMFNTPDFVANREQHRQQVQRQLAPNVDLDLYLAGGINLPSPSGQRQPHSSSQVELVPSTMEDVDMSLLRRINISPSLRDESLSASTETLDISSDIDISWLFPSSVSDENSNSAAPLEHIEAQIFEAYDFGGLERIEIHSPPIVTVSRPRRQQREQRRLNRQRRIQSRTGVEASHSTMDDSIDVDLDWMKRIQLFTFLSVLDDASLEGVLGYWNWHARKSSTEFKRLRGSEISKLVSQLDSDENSELLGFFLKLLDAQEASFQEGFGRLACQVINVARTFLRVDGDVRASLMELICSSTTSCVDKPVAALCQVQIYHQIMLARGSREEMRSVGRTVMYMEEIESAANELERDGEDFTSCFLELVIALKDVLNLPIDITTLRHLCGTAACRADIVASTCMGITDEMFEGWLETWSEWQREQRMLVLSEMHWSDLQCCEIWEEALEPVYTLYGEECDDPVLIGSSWWSWNDFSKHWLETGRDMYNIDVPNDELRQMKRMPFKIRDGHENELA